MPAWHKKYKILRTIDDGYNGSESGSPTLLSSRLTKASRSNLFSPNLPVPMNPGGVFLLSPGYTQNTTYAKRNRKCIMCPRSKLPSNGICSCGDKLHGAPGWETGLSALSQRSLSTQHVFLLRSPLINGRSSTSINSIHFEIIVTYL
jgi:hypothetical protein